MKSMIVVCGAVILSLIGSELLAQRGGGGGKNKDKDSVMPTFVEVVETYPGRIADDGRGRYEDGADCVESKGGSQAGGVNHMWTVSLDPLCSGLAFGVWRYMSVNFSDLVDDLGFGVPDIDGFVSPDGVTELVPMRLIIHGLFAPEPGADQVRVLVWEVDESGAIGQDDRAWRFEYRNEGQVLDNGDGTLTVTMLVGQAVADVCEKVLVPRGNGYRASCEPRGAYDLPFRVTVGPLP